MKPLVGLFLFCFGCLGAARDFDVVVYGGTAGGVITSVSAAREGLKVVLLEPGRHLGGMVSGGLGRTDVGRKEVIGGYSLEFFTRVGKRYNQEGPVWLFEPHVAEQVFRAMVKEAGVTVLFGHRLREHEGVRMNGSRVEEITTENGSSFSARIFADCSYEGDLMARAGVSYTWGRENVAQYGESLAGVRDRTPYHQFQVKVPAFDANGDLLPGISSSPVGEVGSADRKVQAYNFRLCLTDNPANRIPFPRPLSYDPKSYKLLANYLRAWTREKGEPPRFAQVCDPGRIPNRKTDTNNNGAFSTDFIMGSWDYPEGDYKTRAAIWQKHVEYTQGFFYFLSHDPQVPAALRKEAATWGLAKDEFVDNHNWPHQLYIREARRMTGEYVLTQKDLQTDRVKPDPIGMGSYNSDSHNVQRVVADDRTVVNEGDMQVPVQPYQLPYRMLLPKKSEAVNLLVPVCFAASHVAYSSARMEPQYMILGHAAGVAARMAIEKKTAVQDIDTAELTGRLKSQGAVMELRE